MRIASIDIGTNTCSLSIAEYFRESGLRFIYKDKKVIALINQQFKNESISEETIYKLISVLRHFIEIIEGFKVEKIIAVATSGIRSAANKDFILKTIEDILGINVIMITGQNEAELVFEGVKNAVPMSKKYVLIMDIGGGSLEFVICNDKGILCTYSFDIGASRLLYKNNFSDPLSSDDVQTLNGILEEKLHVVIEESRKVGVKTLIGSSGSFETFVDLINQEMYIRDINESQKYAELDIEEFNEIYKQLIKLNYKKRAKMPGMDIMKVKLIPISAVMTKQLIESIPVERLIQSRYSIKEGIIFDYICKNFI